jgi:hypothetical protein
MIWDSRKAATPQYRIGAVHTGAVGAPRWNPDARSQVYSGGRGDRVLKLINTRAIAADGSPQARSDNPLVHINASTGSVITGIAAPRGTREVLTSHGADGGHLQLRNATTLKQIGTYCAPLCSESVDCMAMSPDGKRVVGVQNDALKFWLVWPPTEARKRKRSETPTSAIDDEVLR